MKLSDFLAAERILVPLPGETLEEAAGPLLERLSASGVVADVERLRKRAGEERSEDIVAIADRAFVLHFRTDTAASLAVALGVAPTAVRREGDDPTQDAPQQCAPIVVVVVSPLSLAARHLQVVRGFSRLLSKQETVDAVIAAGNPEEIARLSLFAHYELPEQLLVRDLMTERPRATDPDVPLRDAARELMRLRVSALPVVDTEGRLLGMLSERELMRHLLTTEVLSHGSRHAPPSQQPRKTVRDVMTRQVLCVAPEQAVAEVASLMSNKDVERVPVVREGRLVGFLTRGDIVRKLIGP